MSEEIRDRTNELGRVLIDNYSQFSTHPLFTLWGCAYHWKDGILTEETEGTHADYIPQLLKYAKQQGISFRSPVCPVPRSRREGHYSSICLSNQDRLETVVSTLLDSDLEAPVLDLVSDQRLLRDAAEKYVSLVEDEDLKEMDFINFLLRYHPIRIHELHSDELNGVYLPLAERLLYRFEEKTEEAIFQSNAGIIQRAAELHQQVLFRLLKVDPEMKALYEELRIEIGADKSNGSYDVRKITRATLPGPRLVRKTTGSAEVDFSALLDAREKSLRVAETINASAIYLNMSVDLATRRFQIEFERNPEGTLKKLERLATTSKGSRKDVFREVLGVYSDASFILQTPEINHEMSVVIPNAGESE